MEGSEEADKLKRVSVEVREGPLETTTFTENVLTDSAAVKAEELAAQDEGTEETDELPVAMRSVEEREEDTETGNLIEEGVSQVLINLAYVIAEGKKTYRESSHVAIVISQKEGVELRCSPPRKNFLLHMGSS